MLCLTRPQYVVKSYRLGGRERVPGREEDITAGQAGDSRGLEGRIPCLSLESGVGALSLEGRG